MGQRSKKGWWNRIRNWDRNAWAIFAGLVAIPVMWVMARSINLGGTIAANIIGSKLGAILSSLWVKRKRRHRSSELSRYVATAILATVMVGVTHLVDIAHGHTQDPAVQDTEPVSANPKNAIPSTLSTGPAHTYVWPVSLQAESGDCPCSMRLAACDRAVRRDKVAELKPKTGADVAGQVIRFAPPSRSRSRRRQKAA
jgi:hypothetical protein